MNTDEYEYLIKRAVDSFLGWRLPNTFRPNGGIHFEPVGNKGTPYEFTRRPMGTNLFSGEQAEAMFRACIPREYGSAAPDPAPDRLELCKPTPSILCKLTLEAERLKEIMDVEVDKLKAKLAEVEKERDGFKLKFEAQQFRIAELEERLELTAENGVGELVKIDIGECDGIACRDETIKWLEGKEARLAAKLAEVEKERDALKAKLEHADARIRRLEACIEDFLELTEVPDANCSCHLAPPCGDCVEYGSIREVRALANALLKERGV